MIHYTEQQLKDMSSGELVKLYNEVAVALKQREVTKFSDKVTAVKRTLKILGEHQASAPKTKETKTKTKSEAPRKTRIMRFNFVPDDKTEVRVLKNTATLRGRCVTLLKEGATFEQVEKLVQEFDADTGRDSHDITRRAYELVRIMHYWLGYGVRHDIESGIIKLYVKK